MTGSDLKYGWIFFWSFISLLVERLWSSFWPALSLLFLYAGLSMLNMVSVFGVPGHASLLLILIASLSFSLARLGRPFRFPRPDEVERFIEEQSALEHRPLESLHDRPIAGLSADALHLWDKHLERLSHLRSRLRIYLPRPDTSRQDKFAFRHAALMLLVLGLVVAQGQAISRLKSGFLPDVGAWMPASPAVSLDAWITPPEYTRQTPVFLASTQPGVATAAEEVSVPEGSLLKIHTTGKFFSPKLYYAGKKYPFTGAGNENYSLELPLTSDGALFLRQGFRKAGQWAITVTPDMPPSLALEAIGRTQRDSLKITYRAKDDYGIAKIYGTITAVPELTDALGRKTLALDLLLPPADRESNTSTLDLTAHPWAGLPAQLTLTAEDNAGHVSDSETKTFVMPERRFTNPLAQSIIEERKKLLWSAGNLLVLRAISFSIAAIAEDPSLYKGDIVLYMAMNAAAWHLIYDETPQSLESVQSLLWDIALKLEDGGLSLAARNLNEALQKLSQALNDKNSSKEQLKALAEEVQARMQDYLHTLARELQQRLKNGQPTQAISPEIAQKFMKHIDLQQLLEQFRQLSQGDTREAMQKMTEYLKSAVENLDVAKMEQMQKDQAQAMQSLQELQDLIHRQQALLDKTNKMDPSAPGRSAPNMNSGALPAPGQEESQEQSDIRGKLGDTMRKLGEVMKEIPENFGKADRSMKASQKSFQSGKPRDSVPHQKTALEELQKGMDNAIEKMSENMQQTLLSFGFPPQGSGEGEGYDPLGREDGTGKAAGGDANIPTEKEQRRVQQIIEELRKRLNDYQRSKVERDYIDRLLERFD